MYEVKQFIPKNFDIKDMGETSYVIDIKMHKDRSSGILGLSQKPILAIFWRDFG